MARLRNLKPKEVVRALIRAGFFFDHQKGSHIHLCHDGKPNVRVTIPFHSNFDLPISIIKSILRQAEISPKEFLDLL